MQLQEVLSDSEKLLELEPEELAAVVLKILVAASEEKGSSSVLNSYNFFLPHNLQGYSDQESVSKALMEAWIWLEREGLIARKPADQSNWIFVTRRGHTADQADDWKAYHKANLLPRQFLHPAITIKVWPNYLRGDYETAVFQAYKELEVMVRDAIGEELECLGTNLMRKAFNHKDGELTDTGAPKAEREALAHLFAGAIGSYKNPHSHRHVSIDSREASEMIILASHLMNIVEKRIP